MYFDKQKFMVMHKCSAYYASIMLNAFRYLLCSLLCQHNWRSQFIILTARIICHVIIIAHVPKEYCNVFGTVAPVKEIIEELIFKIISSWHQD